MFRGGFWQWQWSVRALGGWADTGMGAPSHVWKLHGLNPMGSVVVVAVVVVVVVGVGE